MLSTGEKIVPGATERAALAHPGVAAAIVFGRGRAQAGLLLTLHPGAEVQDVWPAVAAANAGAPAFAHVHEEMLLCADPARPLPLTPKGTIMRKAALALYAPDIERL
jgi:acyl-coenzyme A synthetase/AMP-(fatty) acid ligase